MPLSHTRSWIAFGLVGFVSALSIMAFAAELTSTTDKGAAHPLEDTIRYVTSRADYIREHVNDYSCRLVKRERIRGHLQSRQFADMNVRCERRRDDGSTQPLSVFMQFLAPKAIKDRRVLYVADQNEGKVLVRKGGFLAKSLKLKVDPFGDQARSESKKPITDISFDKLLDGLAQQARANIDHDPMATNTLVSYFPNETVNHRQCTQIRIVHPNRSDELEFHIASLYMDDELHVPVRLVIYGWPDQAGEEPPINEEYNYIDLRLNAGLTDADFSETLLEGPYVPQTARASNLSR